MKDRGCSLLAKSAISCEPAQPVPPLDTVAAMSTVSVATGRIPIRDVAPLEDGGRWPAKAVVGETFPVTATIFREGHDAVAANIVLRGPKGAPKAPWTPMHRYGLEPDRWTADVCPTAEGDWTFQIEAWSDPVATWLHTAEIKLPAGLDVELVSEEGARLFERLAAGLPKPVAQGGGSSLLLAGRSRPARSHDPPRDPAGGHHHGRGAATWSSGTRCVSW